MESLWDCIDFFFTVHPTGVGFMFSEFCQMHASRIFSHCRYDFAAFFLRWWLIKPLDSDTFLHTETFDSTTFALLGSSII